MYADIPLAIKMAQEKNPGLKVMVVDLDAHQGNGCSTLLKDESIFKNPDLVTIFDVHNKNKYPNGHDKGAQKGVLYNYGISSKTTDNEYLTIVKDGLGAALETIKPDLIIYNAGTDILKGDHVGGLNISKEAIIKRDELVFGHALNRKIPIVMVLSGGYTDQSHEVIEESIENLSNNYGLFPSNK